MKKLNPKPTCKLIGKNGNIFSLMNIVNRVLKENGLERQSKEMLKKMEDCRDYEQGWSIFKEYVDII